MSTKTKDTTPDTTTPDTTTPDTVTPAGPRLFSLSAARSVAQREDRGAVLYLRDEQGEPLYTADAEGNAVPAYMRIAGRHSTTYRRAEQAVNDRTLKRRTTELTAELVDRNELEKLAACVLEWNLRDGSTPMPLTAHNAAEVFRAAPWIRRDAEQLQADPARFLD
jgi:hypothetical protein